VAATASLVGGRAVKAAACLGSRAASERECAGGDSAGRAAAPRSDVLAWAGHRHVAEAVLMVGMGQARVCGRGDVHARRAKKK
jgi:hypothetical protein